MPELKLTTYPLSISDVVLDTAVEQSLELDFLLPDYEPEVFTVLKARATPIVQRTVVNGGRLEISGSCSVTVFYLSEQPGDLRAVRQSAPFTKTVELKTALVSEGYIQCVPCTYFINARAVSSRRLEVRCGISLRTRLIDISECPVITDAEGMGVQLHCTEIMAPLSRKSGYKRFTMSEDLQLGQAKPAFGSLLDADYHFEPTDQKLMEGKIICRGDLITRILYCPEGGGAPERMEWSEPVSQILEIPGITEEDSWELHAEGIEATFEPIREEGGCRSLSAEWNLTLCVTADRSETVRVADDGFSCRYPAQTQVRSLALTQVLGTIHQTASVNGNIEVDGIDSLYAVLPSLGEYSCHAEKTAEGETLTLSGTVEVTALYSINGTVALTDKTLLYEAPFSVGGENMTFFPSISILSADGRVRPDGVELEIRLSVSGNIYQVKEQKMLTGIEIEKENPFSTDGAAIRICYAEPGESIWEIAKRSKTSMQAMIEENGLSGETVEQRQMLLIPMVSQ